MLVQGFHLACLRGRCLLLFLLPCQVLLLLLLPVSLPDFLLLRASDDRDRSAGERGGGGDLGGVAAGSGQQIRDCGLGVEAAVAAEPGVDHVALALGPGLADVAVAMLLSLVLLVLLLDMLLLLPLLLLLLAFLLLPYPLLPESLHPPPLLLLPPQLLLPPGRDLLPSRPIHNNKK